MIVPNTHSPERLMRQVRDEVLDEVLDEVRWMRAG
jgi:hypothetical protein